MKIIVEFTEKEYKQMQEDKGKAKELTKLKEEYFIMEKSNDVFRGILFSILDEHGTLFVRNETRIKLGYAPKGKLIETQKLSRNGVDYMVVLYD